MGGTHGGGSSNSPTRLLRDTPPPDDAGAATFDRYEWQAVMASADVLALYYECLDEDGIPIEGASFEVICEHHEDWALSDGDAAEIVSAKHRETSVGAFTTIRSLLVEGGLLHLLDRWQALGRTPSCRLVTTAGLAADARSMMTVAQAFQNGESDGPERDAIMTKLVRAVARERNSGTNGEDGSGGSNGHAAGVEDRETLAAFLRVLLIQESQPSRDYVALMAPEAYAQPVADKCLASTAAGAIWTAVLGLVRERMRAAGPRMRGRLPTVLGGRDESGYEARTVTLVDVTVAVRVAIENQAGFRPLPRRIRTSRVAIKMVTGGCSDNAVERAEELRRQYRQYWREIHATPSLTSAQQHAENALLRVIDEATEIVRTDNQQWGSALWSQVQIRLDDAVADGQSHGLDADLLLGGISELSNQCKAWFSDSFDVDAQARLQVQATTGWDLPAEETSVIAVVLGTAGVDEGFSGS